MDSINKKTSKLLISTASYFEELVNIIMKSKFEVSCETVTIIYKFMNTCFSLMEFVSRRSVKKDFNGPQNSLYKYIPSNRIEEKMCHSLLATTNYFEAQSKSLIDSYHEITQESFVELNKLMDKCFNFMNYIDKGFKNVCESVHVLNTQSNDSFYAQEKLFCLLLTTARYFEILAFSVIESEIQICQDDIIILRLFVCKSLSFVNYVSKFENYNFQQSKEESVSKLDRKTFELLLSTGEYIGDHIGFIMKSKFKLSHNSTIYFEQFLSKCLVFMNFIYRSRFEIESSNHQSSIIPEYKSDFINAINSNESQKKKNFESGIEEVYSGSNALDSCEEREFIPSSNMNSLKINTKKIFFVPKIITEDASSKDETENETNDSDYKLIAVNGVSPKREITISPSPSKEFYKTFDSSVLAKYDINVGEIFKGYIQAIADGLIKENNMGIYCEPCDTIVNKGDPWLKHQNFAEHVKKVENKIHSLKFGVMYKCSRCYLTIYGKHFIANILYGIHLNVIHNEYFSPKKDKGF